MATIKTEEKVPEKEAEGNTTLFVRSLPFSATSDSLSDFFSQICPVKHSVVVTDRETKQSKGFGFVTFSFAEDAKKALEESRKLKFDGRTLQVVLAKKRERTDEKSAVKSEKSKDSGDGEDGTVKRRPRLIIRNLPWAVRDPQDLVKLFSRYGKVTEALIPRTSHGRMSGFAFITMKKRTSAEKAIKEGNGMKIEGRAVAVDYAVEKDTWRKHVETGLQVGQDALDISDEDSGDSDAEESDADSIKSEPEDDVSIKSEDDDDVSMKSEDDDDEEDEVEDEFDEDEDEDDSEEEDVVAKPRRPDNVKDTYTDTTVFIRNLSYQSTQDSLREHFEENFGPVRYALPVVDKETGQARGTAFVCFREREAYEACLASAPKQVSESSILIADDVDRRYVVDDRVLSVTAAVDRGRAGKLAEDGALKRQVAAGKELAADKDKRHLFLLNEGRIAADSELGRAMSKTDMDIRQQSLAVRRQQLRTNPSLHLSLTRLAVRNIPRSMTATQLKLLARRAIVGFAEEVKAGQREPLSREENERSQKYETARGSKLRKKKYGVVKQVKLITEDKKSGTGRSRGYGFIEYASHRLALMGLRWLNAREIGYKDLVALQQEFAKAGDSDDEDAKPKKKAKVITDKEDLRKRRLVVEFAVENIEVVKRRQTREARFREKIANANLPESEKKEDKVESKRNDKPAKGNRKDKQFNDKRFKEIKAREQPAKAKVAKSGGNAKGKRKRGD